jgi:taurine dioxygenase
MALPLARRRYAIRQHRGGRRLPAPCAAAASRSDENAARAVHPVLRVHDESGTRALYVSRLMTERIVGFPETESDALLNELYDAIDAFPYYEHRWSVGDTVIWDNRSVSHSRSDFDATERRLLKRVTIVGR